MSGGHLNDEASRARRKRYYREVMYPARREKYLETSKRNIRERRAELMAEIHVLKSKPCVDCGGTFPSVCMDFDHIDGHVKVNNIATMVHGLRRIAVIRAEIAKCEVVCSNCHRIRTANRTAQRGQNHKMKDLTDCPQLSLLEAV